MAEKIKLPFIRNPYNYSTDEATLETAIKNFGESRTQQQFCEESDINYIADKYGLTGPMPQVLNPPSYGDFSGIFDFQSAQNAVIKAKADFLELPAKLRARFQNSPQHLLEFLENPDNRAEAEFLGLIPKPEPTNGRDPQESTSRTEKKQARNAGTERTPDASEGPQGPGQETHRSDRGRTSET